MSAAMHVYPYIEISHCPLGPMKTWVPDMRLPDVLSLERAFEHYLDISSCPAQSLLEQLALTAGDDTERYSLLQLAKVRETGADPPPPIFFSFDLLSEKILSILAYSHCLQVCNST